MALSPVSPLINRGIVSDWLQDLPAAVEMLTVDTDGNVSHQAIPVASFEALTGDPEDNTALAAALAGKAALSHTHEIANVTGLQTALDAKAATTHTHVIADTTGLQAALDAKLNLSGGTLTGGTVTVSNPVLMVTQTWNNAAVAFNALNVDITNTASAIQSTFATFRRGGTNRIVLYDRYDNVAQGPGVQFGSGIVQEASGGHVALGTTGDAGMVGLSNGLGLSMHPSRYIGWGSTGSATRDQGSTWADVRMFRGSGPSLQVQAAGGLQVRGAGGSGDAALAAGVTTLNVGANVNGLNIITAGYLADQYVDVAFQSSFVTGWNLARVRAIARPGYGGALAFHYQPGGPSGPTTEGMRLTETGNVGIGQSSPNVGLVIRRSGADLPSLRLEDGDITVPFTSLPINPLLNANTVGNWAAAASASGGCSFSGWTNNTAAAYPLMFAGYHGSTAPTKPALNFSAFKSNGGSDAASLASSELIAGFYNGSAAGTPIITFSASGTIAAASAAFTGLVTVGTYTVATLPSAAANAGALAQVTDSSVTANGSAVAGGGANRVVVFSNGSTWDVVVA